MQFVAKLLFGDTFVSRRTRSNLYYYMLHVYNKVLRPGTCLLQRWTTKS